MRILILHSRYLSGPVSGENRVVEDEASLLSEGGHEVDLYAPSPHDTGATNSLQLAAKTVWSLSATRELRRRIASFKPDIIHCHNLFPMLSPAVLRVPDRPAVVMTLHNYRLMCLPATLLRDGEICELCVGRNPLPGVRHRCYRGSLPGSGALAASLTFHRHINSFDRVNLFLAVSDFLRSKHIDAGLPKERIQVKPNFAWSMPQRDGAGRYFLYMGRLAPEKGVRSLLEAWRGVAEPLMIAGSGPDEHALRSEAPSGARFLGPVAPGRIPELLRNARAVLIPSIWYEGAPRAILEAYAAGVPVIASRIGGLAEVVDDGISGLLVDPGDHSAWQAAARSLLDDRRSEQLGRGAYAMWQRHFSPDRALHNLEKCYEQALIRG